MADNFELMHSYPDFPRDAIEAFHNLTGKYKLKPKAEGICSIDFDNPHCRLNFNMDRYDLQGVLFRKHGWITKKIDDFPVNIVVVANLLTPNHPFADTYPKTTYGDTHAIRQLLFWYAELIENCLSTVLNGDFSWYEKQKNADLYQRKLVGVVLGKHMDREHPISKKFWSGDKTWKQDVEKFIQDNHIQLE
jgi:hypothetical protein